MGHSIAVISSEIGDGIKELLSNKYDVKFYLMRKIVRGKNALVMAKNNIQFRLFSTRIIRQLAETADVFWISGISTAIPLHKSKILKRVRYCFTCHELWGHSYLFRKIVKDVMANSYLNIVPEHNRAQIYRQWFGLQTTPFVLPNKTTLLLEKITQLETSFFDRLRQTNAIIEKSLAATSGKKVVLYQGGISDIRGLDRLVSGVKERSNDYSLVLMGAKSNYLSKLQKLWPDLIHIDYIPAPYHLEVTKLSDVGVVSYDYSRLNHVFCGHCGSIPEYLYVGQPLLTAIS